MQIHAQETQLSKQQKTCLILGLYEDGILSGTAKEIDQISHGYLSKLIKQGTFEGKLCQILPLFHLPGTDFSSILLVGCGKKELLKPSDLRKLVCMAVQTLNNYRLTEATCYLTEVDLSTKKSIAWKVKSIAEFASEGLYTFDVFKSQKGPQPTLKEFIIDVSDHQALKSAQMALKQGLAIAKSVAFTKNLANTPSNICTPSFLADQAKALAKDYPSLSVKILEEKEMQKLGMGALLAVAQGSAEAPKLICLEYKGNKKKEAPIALVGKGVTFDTGGNSLKTPDNMVGMKYDMSGAATVLGTLKAVATLELPLHVVGIIPAVENMPGGTAYKPEDIVTSLSGQTIEIISTDAEGRLILADAMTYSEKNYHPKVIIDIATLTGAVVIALGLHATAVLSNDSSLVKDLLKAGEESNDRVWELPLWDEYQEQLKSPFADMTNVGGRAAGTITAACFLSRFAKNVPWAHLDVAGTAAVMSGNSERMATGRPVPLLVQYLLDQCK